MSDLAALLARTHRVRCWERADRDPVDLLCTCGWSEVRWPQRTNKRPDCPIHGQTDRAADDPKPEQVAQLFHETYERLAPSFGYETRKASAVPWADVPVQNKRLMIAVAGEVLRALVDGQPAPDTDPDDDLRFQLEVETGMSARWFGAFAEARDQLTQALALLRSHAEVCSRVGCSDQLLTEADGIETLGGPATPGPTREQAWRDLTEDAIAYIDTFKHTRPDRGKVASEFAERAAALFGRSAPEPPATPADPEPLLCPLCDVNVNRWFTQRDTKRYCQCGLPVERFAEYAAANEVGTTPAGEGAPESPETQR